MRKKRRVDDRLPRTWCRRVGNRRRRARFRGWRRAGRFDHLGRRTWHTGWRRHRGMRRRRQRDGARWWLRELHGSGRRQPGSQPDGRAFANGLRVKHGRVLGLLPACTTGSCSQGQAGCLRAGHCGLLTLRMPRHQNLMPARRSDNAVGFDTPVVGRRLCRQRGGRKICLASGSAGAGGTAAATSASTPSTATMTPESWSIPTDCTSSTPPRPTSSATCRRSRVGGPTNTACAPARTAAGGDPDQPGHRQRALRAEPDGPATGAVLRIGGREGGAAAHLVGRGRRQGRA